MDRPDRETEDKELFVVIYMTLAKYAHALLDDKVSKETVDKEIWRFAKEQELIAKELYDDVLALFPDIEQIRIEVEAAEKRGIDTALTAYESACESLIEEAKREERERIEYIAIQAIADEPEFPSNMPDELWKEIHGNREITERVMKNTVRVTKRDITNRFLQALKEGK